MSTQENKDKATTNNPSAMAGSLANKANKEQNKTKTIRRKFRVKAKTTRGKAGEDDLMTPA